MFATTEWMNVLEKNKSLEIVDLNNMCAVFFLIYICISKDLQMDDKLKEKKP